MSSNRSDLWANIITPIDISHILRLHTCRESNEHIHITHTHPQPLCLMALAHTLISLHSNKILNRCDGNLRIRIFVFKFTTHGILGHQQRIALHTTHIHTRDVVVDIILVVVVDVEMSSYGEHSMQKPRALLLSTNFTYKFAG